jgi:hypothetical protein
MTATGVLVALLLAVGCKSEPPPAPAQVSGKVTVGGRPAAKAYVRFHSLADPAKLYSPEVTRVEADGSFSLTVRAGAGEYAVTVCWPSTSYTEPNQKGEEVEGDDRLRSRYDTPERPATKVTLTAGENTLKPITLQAP